MSTADEVLAAQLTGFVRHLARSNAPEDQAVLRLRAAARGRADLLSQIAGLELGAGVGESDGYESGRIAALCQQAEDLDPDEVARWTAQGAANKAKARAIPHTGGGLGRLWIQ